MYEYCGKVLHSLILSFSLSGDVREWKVSCGWRAPPTGPAVDRHTAGQVSSISLFLDPICSIQLFIHLFLFAPATSVVPYGQRWKAHTFHFKPFIHAASSTVDFLVSYDGLWSSGPPVQFFFTCVYLTCTTGKTEKIRKITGSININRRMLAWEWWTIPFSPLQPVQHIAFFELPV